MADDSKDRRSVARQVTQGTVLLRDEKNPSLRILAQLINVTESGFSVSHYHRGFTLDQVVKFQEWFRARVIWNREIDDHVETGFLIMK
jgi:hypothetical protein